MIVWQALERGGYQAGIDYQIRGTYGADRWDAILEWLSPDPYPSEEQCLTWWQEIQNASVIANAQQKAALQVMAAWANRAGQVAQSAAYFQASSNVIWDAIENGKPDVSGDEIDNLHSAFSAAIAQSPFWEESHNWVMGMYDVALNPNNPLHATHGTKAMQIIAWYSFNVVASSVAAQALMLKLAGIGG